MNWDSIILAAGEGTRMLSKTPKVMQKVAGQPMIVRIIEALNSAGTKNIHVVISKKIEKEIIPLKSIYNNIFYHIQKEPNGTADAVSSVDSELSDYVLVCNGDHPLVNQQDIKAFILEAESSNSEFSVATLDIAEPGVFGRVLLQNKNFATEIIEAKHCNEDQLKVKSVNSGFYYGKSSLLSDFLDTNPSDATKEFYLTDIVKYLTLKNIKVSAVKVSEDIGFGVNDPVALSLANQKAYLQINQTLMKKGVRFINPSLSFIDQNVEVENDVTIFPNVFISGASKIQCGTTIEAGAHIINSLVGPDSVIKAGCYIEHAEILGGSSIGPYAHLRKGSTIHPNVKVGNFAEIKNSVLYPGVKAGHQCYLGDSEVGENTNIGAGTITCNFAADGKKHKTIIGKNVFVGSDTQIVPPVTLEDNCVIAAGSTVTKNVEAKSLYVTRAKSVIKSNYRK